MKISFSKNFLKTAKKLPAASRQQVQKRIAVFRDDPFHPLLHNHALQGKLSAYRSINITGDPRALYIEHGDEAIFDVVGTHSQLYK